MKQETKDILTAEALAYLEDVSIIECLDSIKNALTWTDDDGGKLTIFDTLMTVNENLERIATALERLAPAPAVVEKREAVQRPMY